MKFFHQLTSAGIVGADFLQDGGLTISNGLTVFDGGATVVGGLTLSNNGLTVTYKLNTNFYF